MDPILNQINQLIYRIETLSEELEIADEIIDILSENIELPDEAILEAEDKKWIQKAIKKEGSLRKTLKAKEGKNIPRAKLEAAAKKSGKTGARARLALKLRSFKK